MARDLPWRSPGWAAPVTGPLTVVGAAVSAYLTYAHYSTATVLACPDTGVVNCLKVTTSSQATLFGVVPVAVLGLAYFVALLALMSPWAWRADLPPLRWARLAAVVGGTGMVIYLIYVELFELDAICLYCSVVHAVTILLFIATTSAAAFAAPPETG